MHGPLELEFPVQVLQTPGEMIHQLAAKRAISELEAGRGWLPEARDESGQLLEDRYESRFSSMVEREAVRLGVQFQVGGKWCSFVAVEKKAQSTNDQTKDQEIVQAHPVVFDRTRGSSAAVAHMVWTSLSHGPASLARLTLQSLI